MKIEIIDGKAYIYTPYNKDFVRDIKRIGGAKWNGEAWVIQEKYIDVAREIMLECYGETDISNSKTVDIKIEFLDEYSEEKGAVTMFGKTIASAFGRDSGATIGEDVVFTKGKPKSGGSIKNWDTIIPEGSECIVYNVSEQMLKKEYPDVKVEVLESDAFFTDEKADLLYTHIKDNCADNTSFVLIKNIIAYVKKQELNKDKTVELFGVLLDGIGIKTEEIRKIIE